MAKTVYTRITILPMEDVIPFIFTREVRHKLRQSGYGYNSAAWKAAGQKKFAVTICGSKREIAVSLRSHRYQMFVESGTVCKKCGLKGKYFALEKDKNNSLDKFHLNLYGRDKRGKEIMLTKDHIIPRARGGKNRMENYQTLCHTCNQRKGCKIESQSPEGSAYSCNLPRRINNPTK